MFKLLIYFLFIQFSSFAQLEPIQTQKTMFPENKQKHLTFLPLLTDHTVLKANSKKETKNWNIQALSESFTHLDSSITYRTNAGVQLEYHKNKFYNRSMILGGWSSREKAHYLHGSVLPLNQNKNYIFTDFRTRFLYEANQYLDLQAGIDNHFLGEGYQSLILGNQNAPSPFFQVKARALFFEYSLLYQALHEQDQKRFSKFLVFHNLSMNLSQKWNLSFFEMVLFSPKDGNYFRGFDVEYLNPIVFFRPQEYAIGSTDNVLLGSNLTFRPNEKLCFYSQLVLDEFVLSEIKSRSKWWSNKYAVQLGLKAQHQNHFLRLELNMARPYTYGYLSSKQNAGQLGRPIAHPMGANFVEFLTQYENQLTEKLKVSLFQRFLLFGENEVGLSWGGNIYDNYVLHVKEYGNKIGQGKTIRSALFGTDLQYQVKNYELTIFTQLGASYNWGDQANTFLPLFALGLRSELFSRRKLF